jgi:hypothetical protein
MYLPACPRLYSLHGTNLSTVKRLGHGKDHRSYAESAFVAQAMFDIEGCEKAHR